MPFGIIGRTGPGMRHVVGFGNRSTGRGTFEGEFGACHCNQWGLYGVCVRQCRDAALFPNYFKQTCLSLDDTAWFTGLPLQRPSNSFSADDIAGGRHAALQPVTLSN